MFSDPQMGDICKPVDVEGHVLVIRPLEQRFGVPTKFDKPGEPPKDPIAVDVADLTDPDQPIYRNTMWFNGYLIGALKHKIGELVLGTMIKGMPKPGFKEGPWQLQGVPADSADYQTAVAWVNAHPEFAATPLPAPHTRPDPAAEAVVEVDTVPDTPAPVVETQPATQTVELTPETAELLDLVKAQLAGKNPS